ncbi:tRNA-dependent cyclodipeptide synthase [Burkholderia gladioli]|uniref:tRNA-dependent cyclodipeptide synthase n=1 Tax=Burkholderia gladioli TaxID=28095 RepID=UPI00163EBBE3|nr:tRNA-dependent cyclodipeptide synthase [Burkholderia gladioli]
MRLKVTIDETLIGNPPISSIPGARYKAKIDFVSPQSRRDNFQLEQQCFLGVSLENRNFEPARFHSQLEWVSRRFPKCTILIGDSIHRLTLESRSGMPAQEAFDRALQLGQEFMEENRDIVTRYRATTRFEFITCHEIQKTQEYLMHRRNIGDYFFQSRKFRESVESFGLRYHRNDWDTLTRAEQDSRLRSSSNYFIEEFAIFACLVKRGVSVMVYPGSFSTLAEIADHQFPGVSKELESLCVVSLHFKGR